MSGLVTLLSMSLFLGLGCFGIGVLPLSFAYPKSWSSRLSAAGSGILLGAALGVVIPEGVETIASMHTEFPTHKVSISLLLGFIFMLVVERRISSHNHHHHPSASSVLPTHNTDATYDLEFDASLEDPAYELNSAQAHHNRSPTSSRSAAGRDGRQKAVPLTFGLIIHGLADGLALAASVLASGSVNQDASSDLSVVVFLALVIHKAPTVLALSTSLLSTSLSRGECRKYIALFSASTPTGAIISYIIFSLFGFGESLSGIALLFSGGTFLFVATVLQPGSHQDEEGEIKETERLVYTVAGMLTPFLIGKALEHGHVHV